MAISFVPVVIQTVASKSWSATPPSWAEVDVSAYVPADANGVVCIYTGNTGTAVGFHLRQKGSTDNRSGRASGRRQLGVICGIDANKKFEYLTYDNCTIRLIGYTLPDGVTHFANGVDVSPVAGAWTDVDLSVLCPGAIGIILECYVDGAGLNHEIGARMKGSTDNNTQDSYGHNCYSFVVGCDGSQVIQLHREDNTVTWYVTGYIINGCFFFTNAEDYTPAVLSTEEVKVLKDQYGTLYASMGFFEITDGASLSIRRQGETQPTNVGVGGSSAHQGYFANASDIKRRMLIYTEGAATKFYLLGYALGGKTSGKLLSRRIF